MCLENLKKKIQNIKFEFLNGFHNTNFKFQNRKSFSSFNFLENKHVLENIKTNSDTQSLNFLKRIYVLENFKKKKFSI